MPPGATFAESLQAYLDMTLDHLDWARLVVWRALGDGAGDEADESSRPQRQRLEDGVCRIRERQRAGELTCSVSAEFIVLLAHMTAFAPVAMPQMVRDILGVPPDSADYRRLCRDQLSTLLRPGDTASDAPSRRPELT